MADRRRPRRAPRAAASAPAVPAPVRATAETLLLELARDGGVRSARLAQPRDVAAVVETVASAYRPEAPLAAALREDWLRGRGDKAAQLALGWAREQVRLALLDVLQRGRAARLVRTDGDVETLAWLWLVACEALAHEPAGAVPDRVHSLAAFLTGAERVIESR